MHVLQLFKLFKIRVQGSELLLKVGGLQVTGDLFDDLFDRTYLLRERHDPVLFEPPLYLLP